MTPPSAPLRILVSACLLGEKVRYDGGHRRDPFAADVLAAAFDVVPVCPETGCGLPVPREPMRLLGDSSSPRIAGLFSGNDATDALAAFTARTLDELASAEPCGFVCKKGSPSCGARGIVVEGEGGDGRAGLFTGAFGERFPLVPVADEGELRDPATRARFLSGVFALFRLRTGSAGPHPHEERLLGLP